MNQSVDRFQEFATKFEEGIYRAPYVDLGQIDRVPIAMFVGTNDTTCSYDHAIEYIPNFGVDVKLNIV